MIPSQRLQKFGLLTSLYVSQYIPATFLFEALPVFMRQQGLTLDAIGLLPLLALPLTINFLWAPLIDRFGFTRWGHYRFWIIFFQLCVFGVTLFCAGLRIEENFTLLLVCVVGLFLFSSSQDIATDALAVQLLDPQERGIGNGIQRGGGYLGSAIGGGVMLVLLESLGWVSTLLAIAVIMTVALIPILLYQEPIKPQPQDEQEPWNPLTYGRMFWQFCQRPGAVTWLAILVLYSVSSFMASTMFRPLLVDVGLSMSQIGMLQGIVSYGFGMVGAIAAGFLIAPLGRKRSLILLGLLEALTMSGYLLPTMGLTNLWILYSVAICAQVASSMSSVALFTVMMDYSQRSTAGTDFTLQAALIYLCGFAAAAASGAIAEALGYQSVFLISIAIALFSILLVAKVFPTQTPSGI